MVHQTLVLLILLCSSFAFGQDERFYRQILTGELPKINAEYKEGALYQFDVRGASYRIDLNGDGIEESIVPEKRDGVDWLIINDSSERVISETKMIAMGGSSHIYKIRLVQISNTVKALIIFLDEGIIAAKEFESTARIFVLSYENNDLRKITTAMGPHIFQEKESQRDQYFRRDYQVNVYDINEDGIREIAVQYNHIQRIMKYEKGVWKRL